MSGKHEAQGESLPAVQAAFDIPPSFEEAVEQVPEVLEIAGLPEKYRHYLALQSLGYLPREIALVSGDRVPTIRRICNQYGHLLPDPRPHLRQRISQRMHEVVFAGADRIEETLSRANTRDAAYAMHVAGNLGRLEQGEPTTIVEKRADPQELLVRAAEILARHKRVTATVVKPRGPMKKVKGELANGT